MESDKYLQRIPNLESLKKQFMELKNTSDFNTSEWCKYILEESERIRHGIDEEDGGFRGEAYTLPNLKQVLVKAFYPIWVKGDDRTDYTGFGDTKDFTENLRSSGFHKMSDTELFRYLIKNNSIIDSSYATYRNNLIKVILSREKWDNDKQNQEKREMTFKKDIISKFASMYNITDEVSEAVIFYISTTASKDIRKQYKEFNKNTLLALKFINKYSSLESIRVEDAITVLLEHL